MAYLLKTKQWGKRLKNYCNLVPGDHALVTDWWITIYCFILGKMPTVVSLHYCFIYYLLFYLWFYLLIIYCFIPDKMPTVFFLQNSTVSIVLPVNYLFVLFQVKCQQWCPQNFTVRGSWRPWIAISYWFLIAGADWGEMSTANLLNSWQEMSI